MTVNQLREKLIVFQNTSGYQFSNINLLITAFTHSSFANESRGHHLESNERLEFLGDAVLSIIISDYIYRSYPNFPEGELTRIRAGVVREGALAQCAKQLHMGQYLLLGKGEEMTGGRERDSILSDAFEAVLAAIYLDSDLEGAKKWALNHLKNTLEAVAKGTIFQDYKTLIQEAIQKNDEERLDYEIVKESGPDHNKEFLIQIRHHGRVIGTGTGKSKKEAEQNAARQALITYIDHNC